MEVKDILSFTGLITFIFGVYKLYKLFEWNKAKLTYELGKNLVRANFTLERYYRKKIWELFINNTCQGGIL